MDLMKPVWLVYAVDIAQLVSALGTVAAVIVALRLASRAESQRLQFFSGIYADTVTGNDPGHSYLEYSISITVVNSGVLPAVIKSAAFIFDAPDREWSWHFGPVYGTGEFPMTLEHGQQVRSAAPFEIGNAPWDQIPLKLITSKRMRFLIETSLGKTYVHRPNKMTLLAMRGNIQSARDLRNSSIP